MASDGPSGDPRTHLPAAIEAALADDLDAALTGILEAGLVALGASSAAILLADPDRAGLQLVATAGLAPDDVAALATSAQGGRDPHASVSATRTARFEPSTAYLPLVVTAGGVETSLGTLALTWPEPRDLDASEQAVAGSLAALAALATDRARNVSSAAERSEWFERMAHTDPLTGLANERTVGRVLELELARAGRQGSEVSLALFDVDDFRSANASDGHEVGDDILRRVAAVLAESVRLVDTVGRIGGDEFVLVAPGSAGAVVARRVQDGIAALPAVAGRAVSVSAGVATFPADGSDAGQLISAATAALDMARGTGAGAVAGSETSV